MRISQVLSVDTFCCSKWFVSISLNDRIKRSIELLRLYVQDNELRNEQQLTYTRNGFNVNPLYQILVHRSWSSIFDTLQFMLTKSQELFLLSMKWPWDYRKQFTIILFLLLQWNICHVEHCAITWTRTVLWLPWTRQKSRWKSNKRLVYAYVCITTKTGQIMSPVSAFRVGSKSLYLALSILAEALL